MHAPYDPALLDAIESFALENWSGTAWRATIGDAPVLRANAFGARWNPAGLEALYCSLDRDVALAEIGYLVKKQPVAVSSPMRITRLSVRLHKVVDLSSEGSLERLGHSIADVGLADHRIPQHIGGAVAWLEFPGMLVPSVRAPGTNLVVFVAKQLPNDVVDVFPVP